MDQYRPRLNESEYELIKEHRNKNNNNKLIIGDLHAPFIKEGYLEHCQHIYEKHQCTEVIFIGDLIDNHYSSYHESDPDGMGAGQELDAHFLR